MEKKRSTKIKKSPLHYVCAANSEFQKPCRCQINNMVVDDRRASSWSELEGYIRITLGEEFESVSDDLFQDLKQGLENRL